MPTDPRWPGLKLPDGLVTPKPEPWWRRALLSERVGAVLTDVATTAVTAAFFVTLPVWLPGIMLTMWALKDSEDGL